MTDKSETPLLTDEQLGNLEKQLIAAEIEAATSYARGHFERGPCIKDMEFKALEYIRRLFNDVRSLHGELTAAQAELRGAKERAEKNEQDAERWRTMLQHSKLSDSLWQALPPHIRNSERHLNNALDSYLAAQRSEG